MAQDPTTVAQRWANNLGAAGQRITDGVNSVTRAPGQAAAAQKNVWVQQVANSADKWAARTAAVTVDEWRQAMLTKGVPRIAQGATAAEPKMAQFLQKFLPFQANVVAGLPPRGNLQQNIARMVQMVQKTATYSNS